MRRCGPLWYPKDSRARRITEENDILEGIGGKDLEGFRAVMEAVAEVTQVRLREEVDK
jgi:hypothetical protein